MRHEAIGRNKIKHVQPFHSVQSSGAGGLISPIVEEAGLLSLSERLTYVLNRTRAVQSLSLDSLHCPHDKRSVQMLVGGGARVDTVKKECWAKTIYREAYVRQRPSYVSTFMIASTAPANPPTIAPFKRIYCRSWPTLVSICLTKSRSDNFSRLPRTIWPIMS